MRCLFFSACACGVGSPIPHCTNYPTCIYHVSLWSTALDMVFHNFLAKCCFLKLAKVTGFSCNIISFQGGRCDKMCQNSNMSLSFQRCYFNLPRSGTTSEASLLGGGQVSSSQRCFFLGKGQGKENKLRIWFWMMQREAGRASSKPSDANEHMMVPWLHQCFDILLFLVRRWWGQEMGRSWSNWPRHQEVQGWRAAKMTTANFEPTYSQKDGVSLADIVHMFGLVRFCKEGSRVPVIVHKDLTSLLESTKLPISTMSCRRSGSISYSFCRPDSQVMRQHLVCCYSTVWLAGYNEKSSWKVHNGSELDTTRRFIYVYQCSNV